MTPTTVNGIEELKALVGQTIGPSDWREVTQDDINKFADVSGDHQWIHVDMERAKTESPFGTTIAHGNLTLCMLDGFRDQLFKAESGFKMGINYGWNKVPLHRAGAGRGAHPREPGDRCRWTTSATAGTSSSRSGLSRSRGRRSRPASPSRSFGC